MSYGLHFNGTNSYCRIPVSVTNASSWELTIDLVTDLSDSYNSRIYRQACIFGYDSGGYKSRDFHIDIQRGNLFIFCGLSGNNNNSQLLCGTLTSDTGDYGWNTSKFIADGGVHTIRVKYEQNKISVYLDRVYLGYLNVTSTINSSALYLGCSQTGEKIYARFDLFNLELKINDSLTVQYQPTSTTASDRTLVDSSGNNNNGVLTGTFSVVETDVIAVYADTERCISIPVTLDVDVVRKVNNALYSWYYINPGDASLLSGVTGTTVTGLDASASVTGEAFYQPTRSACFGIAATKEIWIRCDIYTTANYANNDRIRIYSDDANGANGWATNATVSNNYMLVHNGITKTCGAQGDGMFLGAGRRRSVLLHMRSGSSDGLIEFKVATTLGTEYNFSYAGDVNAGNDFANVYIQMDGSNIYVSNLIISNVEISINDGALISNIDAERVISRTVNLLFDTERIVNKSWRYENYGTATLLTVAGNTLTNLPIEKSRIRSAFWQSGREECFGVPQAKELWIKWDLYYTGTAKWRVYDRENGNDTGIARMNSADSLVCYINGPTMVNVKPTGVLTSNTRKTYLMHMVSDATNGYIELWIDGQKCYSDNFESEQLVYKGNVNNGDYFTNLYMQSDNNTNLFSNVIISNRQVGLNENTWNETDAERIVRTSVNLFFDTVRQIVSAQTPVTVDIDLSRIIVNSTTEGFDTERVLLRTEQVDTDIERKLQNTVTIDFDTKRQTELPVEDLYDTERTVLRAVGTVFDTQRILARSVAFNCDIWRQIPHKVNGNTTTLQSVTISLQEQQLTDNVSFVAAEDIEIMEAVDFHVWDYVLRCRAEETSKRGVLLSCQCTCDIDEILYQQLSYSIPENAFEWTYEYEDAYSNYTAEHPDEEIEKMPSAPASAHITSIASSLGKDVSIQFSDWISTMSPEVKTGTNYSGLIEELFGWTARLPHIMINCYMRDGTIYAVQRGHEENTVTLDGLKLTVHTVTKKLVRTTWGSDPNNNTEVEPVYDSWTSEDLTPWPPEEEPEPEGGGGVVHGNDGLVERTEVVHGEERVITTYRYEEMGNGQKFLAEEETVTIVGGQRVDRVITTHKPASYGQAQVYTTDDDGVLGTVVSPTNFDDRISPYQYGEMMNTGGYQAAFASGAHDEYGNYYPAVYSADGTRYLVTGHTGHKKQIGQRTRLNAYALIDTSFPVDGYDKLAYLTEQIKWLDRKTEESVTLELYDYPHLIDFNDRIIWRGNTYYLRSNTAQRTETIVNKQTLEFVRWY